MSVATIKAMTKRIRLRYGSTEAAAFAAGISPGVWSNYENADHPQTTIPLGRLLDMSLTAAELRAFASLFAVTVVEEAADIIAETMEATEAVCRVQGMVRLAAKDGVITEAEARPIRAAALEARAQLDDVIQGVG